MPSGAIPRVGTVLSAVALCLLPVAAQTQTLRQDLWVTNGKVNSLAAAGNVLYVGGNFTRVGPASGGWSELDPASGAIVASTPMVNGVVRVAVPDGSGGMYLGGSFGLVGGQPRSNLAQIDAAGNPTAWNPGANGTVTAMVVGDGALYVGGSFTFFGGPSRHPVAPLTPPPPPSP